MHHKRRRVLQHRGFTTTTPENLPPTPPRAPVLTTRRAQSVAPAPSVAEVRAWACEQGMDVPARGRLRAEIWDAWHTSHSATNEQGHRAQ
nr:histone-like nucleoid-structuring protein Lsr2 [Streptomyces sp. IMTB 2501]